MNTCTFSDCRLYRYTLEHRWAEGELLLQDPHTDYYLGRLDEMVMFIGLNPSTADEQTLDPTLRRCVGYAKRWGFGSMVMTNLFAFRATDPREMARQEHPIAPPGKVGLFDNQNDQILYATAHAAAFIVAAWGVWGILRERDKAVLNLLRDFRLHALSITKDGHPGHPLYLPADQQPRPYPA